MDGGVGGTTLSLFSILLSRMASEAGGTVHQDLEVWKRIGFRVQMMPACGNPAGQGCQLPGRHSKLDSRRACAFLMGVNEL